MPRPDDRRIQAAGRGVPGHDQGNGLPGEPAVSTASAGGSAAQAAVPVDAHEPRPRDTVVVGEFGQPRLDGAYPGRSPNARRTGGRAGVPVGLGDADVDLHALGGETQVGDVGGGQFAAPGAEAKPSTSIEPQ